MDINMVSKQHTSTISYIY